jgi:predicted transcriptional regulator
VTRGELVGLLAEPDRRRVLAALVLGARTPAEVASATGLGPREIGRALQKLEAGGLVDDALDVWAWTEGGATDHATMRRYLADHQLLPRESGEYWRSGGWMDVLDG